MQPLTPTVLGLLQKVLDAPKETTETSSTKGAKGLNGKVLVTGSIVFADGSGFNYTLTTAIENVIPEPDDTILDALPDVHP